jgi:1,4-dihydroxy-2-naphthoate octaprenyltransferase
VIPRIADYLGPARVPFLPLALVCAGLGAAVAHWRGASIDPLDLFLVMAGAVLAHMSVNSLNEYHDFRNGLDARTRRTPFSGGSGTLQRRPGLGSYALALGLGSAAFTAAIGARFVVLRGWGILPLGLAGLAVVLSYTPVLTRHWLWCLIAPGLGFGTFIVMGAEFALSGVYSWTGFWASLVPFFLVANLLLLNQFPDLGPDRHAGRRHLIIVHGTRAGAVVHAIFNALAYASLVAGWAGGVLPAWSLLGLLTLPAGAAAGWGALRYHRTPGKLAPYLALNVVANLLTPALMAVGMVVA